MRGWKSNQEKVRRRKHRVALNKPPAGSRPGTLVVPVGSPAPRVRAIRYAAEVFEERELADARELAAFCARGGNLWLDVQGLGSRELLEELGRQFRLHPLLLADVVHVPQRPKVEPYEEATFVVARRLRWKGAPGDPVDERQVSLVLAPGHVLSFHEREDDVFAPVRARLEQGAGLLRGSGTDYLAYALLDAIVDDYLPIMDRIGEQLESIEERVIACPTRALLHELSGLRGDLVGIRRDVWPLREALSALLRGDVGAVSEPVKLYLRDVQDHCIQVVELLEVYREIASNLQNLYLTAIANRTNEVMKVLTVVSTIFIPLTFLVGVWGMNFRHMPELGWPWAYPTVLVLMLLLSGLMLVYFRRKGWLGNPPE
jgi:magnesium transporter